MNYEGDSAEEDQPEITTGHKQEEPAAAVRHQEENVPEITEHVQSEEQKLE